MILRRHFLSVGFFCACLAMFSGSVAFAKATLKLPPELKKTQVKYKSAKTLMADFEQVVSSALTQSEKKSSGKIWIQLPDKIRWETTSPDPSVLVSDGKVFWFYTPPFDPTDAPDIVTRKASQVQSRLAYALLAGRFDTAPIQSIRAEKKSGLFRIIPLKGSAGTVKEATVGIQSSGSINKVSLKHSDGNAVTIDLTNIRFGESIDPSVFAFKP